MRGEGPDSPHPGRPPSDGRPEPSSAARELTRRRLAFFTAVMLIMGGVFGFVQWSAWQTREYAAQAARAVSQLVNGCRSPDVQPESGQVALVICRDLDREFVVIRGEVREVGELLELEFH